MNLYFVRHAQSQIGADKPNAHPGPSEPLSALGRNQAHKLVMRMRTVHLDTIITSPEVRAYQTGEIIANSLALSLEIQPLLVEWIMPSCIHGKAVEEYPHDYEIIRQRRFVDPNAKFEDGESLSEVIHRTERAKDYLMNNHSEKDIIVISHYSFIRFFTIRELLGSTFSPSHIFKAANAMELGNTGIVQFYGNIKENLHLILWNDRNHLS